MSVSRDEECEKKGIENHSTVIVGGELCEVLDTKPDRTGPRYYGQEKAEGYLGQTNPSDTILVRKLSGERTSKFGGERELILVDPYHIKK